MVDIFDQAAVETKGDIFDQIGGQGDIFDLVPVEEPRAQKPLETPEWTKAFDVLSPSTELPENLPTFEIPDIPGVKESGNMLKLAAGAVNRGLASFSDSLDSISSYISDVTGLPKGGAFEAARDFYLENADYWEGKVKDAGFTEEVVGEFIGGAAPGMAEFMLGVPFAAVRGQAVGGPLEAGKQVAHRALMGQILHASNILTRGPRTATMAAAGAVEAAGAGAEPREIAKSAGVMAGFGLTAPGRGKGLREIVRDIRTELPLEKFTPGEKVAEKAKKVPPPLPSARPSELVPTGLPVPSGALKPIPKGQRRSFLLNQASDRLEVPIRHGKFRTRVGGAKATGIYKPHEKVIRLARANDVETAVHEIAHHVENLLGLPKVMSEEVRKMAYAGAKDINKEGFAEFLKYYVTQPNKARTEAPTFYEQFEAALKTQPDVQEIVVKARSAWELWQASPSVSKVHSMIRRGGEKRRLPTMNEVYTRVKDSIYPLREAVKAAEKITGGPLATSEDPYIMARLTRGWARKAEQYLKYGTFQYDEAQGAKFTGKSLREVLKPIEARGERELLDTYLVAKRAASDPRILKGFKGILSIEDFRQTIKELEPRFKDTAEALYKYSDELLTYLTDSGRINQETANAIRSKNLFYAPFYRVMDWEAPLGGLSSRKFSTVFNPIKKLKGSSRDIYSPTESLLYNTFTTINAAERNRVGNALMKLAEKPGMGAIIEKVPPPMKAIKMTKDEALKSLTKGMELEERKAFMDILEDMPEGTLQDMAITFRPNYIQRPNEAIFYKNGKPVMFELSPDLARAISNINASDVGMLVRIASYPAKWLRAGATTFSPEFAIRNPVRDQMTAWIQSKYGYKPGFDFLRGIFNMMGKTELWQKFNASGAAHSAIVSLDRNYISKNLKAMMQEGSVKGMVKHPLELLQIVSEYTEEATRVGEFARALKKEGGDYEALLKAGLAGREVSLDFARQGEASARAANLISAFWNARIEGVDKMVRTFKDNPTKASAKAFLGVTLPSILLWYAQKDDPYYQELPAWRKTLFWNFVLHKDDGGLRQIISIPKPFEYGLIFGSIPESALDWMYTQDPAAFKETMRSMGKTLDVVPIPTGLIPVGEWWANKSWFFDRPIVPRSKEDLEAVLQYGEHTAETVKLIAQIMDKVPGLKEVANPAKIENLIRGYTAGFGRLAMEQADWLIETLGIVKAPPDPSMTLADIPGIRAFVGRFPSANTRSIETFYEKYTALSRKWESQKQRAGLRGSGLKVGAPDQLVEYGKSAKALSVLRKMADQVYQSKDLAPDKKQEALNNIYFGMMNIARTALGKTPINKRGKPQ